MTVMQLRNTLVSVEHDAADSALLAPHKWRLLRRTYKGKEWLYAQTQVHRKIVLMHRLIVGAKKGQHVDHINGNTLDNRRENLRLCTHAENMRNRDGSRFSASGVKGVHKDGDRWRATLEVNGQRLFLGHYDDIELAAAAYRAAATYHHGRFARFATAPGGFPG